MTARSAVRCRSFRVSKAVSPTNNATFPIGSIVVQMVAKSLLILISSGDIFSVCGNHLRPCNLSSYFLSQPFRHRIRIKKGIWMVLVFLLSDALNHRPLDWQHFQTVPAAILSGWRVCRQSGSDSLRLNTASPARTLELLRVQ